MTAYIADAWHAGTRRLGRDDPVPRPATDRSAAVPAYARTVRSWPLLVLAAPAAAEVFSRGRPLEKMSGPHVCPAQRLVMVKLPDVTGVVQGHRRRVVAAWLSRVMGSRLAARARLGS